MNAPFSKLHVWISGHEQHPHPQQYYGHYDHHQQNYAPVHHQGYNQQQQWYPQQQGGYQQEYQYRMPAQDQQHQYHHQMYDQLPMQQPAQHPHSGDSNFNSQFSDSVKGGFHGFLGTCQFLEKLNGTHKKENFSKFLLLLENQARWNVTKDTEAPYDKLYIKEPVN